MNTFKILITCWLLLLTNCFGASFIPEATYEVCFTPGSTCANRIIETINQARQQILVQAYAFTDMDIAHALVQAKLAGIKVKIILDGSQLQREDKIIKLLKAHNLTPVIVNYQPALAHNKVIIVDDTVITGSYNFTYGAKHNAENVLIIKDRNLAAVYSKNWQLCQQHN